MGKEIEAKAARSAKPSVWVVIGGIAAILSILNYLGISPFEQKPQYSGIIKFLGPRQTNIEPQTITQSVFISGNVWSPHLESDSIFNGPVAINSNLVNSMNQATIVIGGKQVEGEKLVP